MASNSQKQKTIRLRYLSFYMPFSPVPGEGKPGWVVLQVTDSIEISPGEVLTKDMVSALCDNGSWKVTIIKED